PGSHRRDDLPDRAQPTKCILRQQHTRHRRHLGLPERGVDLLARDVTCSAASTSRSATGSTAPGGYNTVGRPSWRGVIMLPTPAMWNSGTPMNPTSRL